MDYLKYVESKNILSVIIEGHGSGTAAIHLSVCEHETALTYFCGDDRDVVPFGHFSVQRFQCGDGAVHGIDAEQPLQVCVPVNGVSERIASD